MRQTWERLDTPGPPDGRGARQPPDPPPSGIADAATSKPPVPPSASDSPVTGSLVIDEETFTVTFGRRGLKFTRRQKCLFALLARVARRPGHRVYFDTLREAGDVWDGQAVEDASIRSAVKRLRDKLRSGKLGALALQIVTATYKNREYVVMEDEATNSH
jgi:DNA-binding response OmpR family regulator